MYHKMYFFSEKVEFKSFDGKLWFLKAQSSSAFITKNISNSQFLDDTSDIVDVNLIIGIYL